MPRPATIQLMSPGRIVCERAERVAVIDRAGEQVRHRREADVRVRAHVHAGAGREMERRAAHVIEEHERAEVPARRGRQDALDGESTEISRARLDDLRDCVTHGTSTREPVVARSSRSRCAPRGVGEAGTACRSASLTFPDFTMSTTAVIISAP